MTVLSCLLDHSYSLRILSERSKSSHLSPLLVGMNTENELVTVSVARLRELEALEASIPELLKKKEEEAIEKDKKERLARLTAPRKADPKAYSDKVLKKYHENKQEINAKRREAYRLKKEVQAKQAGSA